MAWIHIIKHSEAKGLLKRQYDAAIKRAAKIWNIVSIMSQNPQVMKDSMKFYKLLCLGNLHSHVLKEKCWLQLFHLQIIVYIEFVLM